MPTPQSKNIYGADPQALWNEAVGFLRRRIASVHDAEDLAGNAIVKLRQKELLGEQIRVSPGAYLMTISHGLIRNYQRRLARTRQALRTLQVLQSEGVVLDSSPAETWDDFRQWSSALPESEWRTVMICAAWQSVTYNIPSPALEVLGVNRKCVRGRLRKAAQRTPRGNAELWRRRSMHLLRSLESEFVSLPRATNAAFDRIVVAMRAALWALNVFELSTFIDVAVDMDAITPRPALPLSGAPLQSVTLEEVFAKERLYYELIERFGSKPIWDTAAQKGFVVNH